MHAHAFRKAERAFLSMKFFSSAALLLLAFGSAYAQGEVVPSAWGQKEVDAYVQAYQLRSATELSDPFAKPPLSASPAERIVLRTEVVMKVEMPSASWRKDFLHKAFWSYDPVREVLELSSPLLLAGTYFDLDWQKSPPSPSREARIQGLNVFVDRKSTQVEMQNAYGTQVQVERVDVISRGIGEIRSSLGDLVMPKPDSAFAHKFQIAPEQARALTQNVALEIVAKAHPWSPSKWVICGRSLLAPTISSPVSYREQGCFLTVKFEALRFIDKRDGSLIKEWRL